MGWLLSWQHVSQFRLFCFHWADFKELCLFRVFLQRHRGSGSLRSDTAITHHSHTLTVGSAYHTARSGPDQQQQQQERHVHGRSSQTGRWLDEGDCGSSQSTTTLPEPNQTTETPTGPGMQSSSAHGSSCTWGIPNGDEHSVMDVLRSLDFDLLHVM